MGATEQGFYDLADSRGIRLERQVAVAGLSSRGHQDPVLATTASPPTLRQLADIFGGLGGDTSRLAEKRAIPLRLDFYAPDFDVFVEVDETQHFSTERARTFESYDYDIHADLVEQYRRVIEKWSETADRYRAAKAAVDFPQLGGRRAQRAYLDAVRDLGALELGIRLLRVPAPECDAALAFERLETALAETQDRGEREIWPEHPASAGAGLDVSPQAPACGEVCGEVLQRNGPISAVLGG